MRLREQHYRRKDGTKGIHCYLVSLPVDIVRASGIEVGEELQAAVCNGVITLYRKDYGKIKGRGNDGK